jgi:hypothetical protein
MAGMFVVFVGNTDNYKELYEDQKVLTTTLQADLTTKDEQYNIQVKKVSELERRLQQELQSLQADKNQLSADLRKSERNAQKAQADADSWKGVMTGFEQSVRNLQASLMQTQEQLDAARAEGVKSQKELNEITAALHEKIVQLQSLEAERRRLLEQKKELEERYATGEFTVREVAPVTPLQHQTATPATAAPAGTNIKGLVVEVQQNLITLSVGSADGVKENMVFHITRGDRFLCDVIITNVDINRCAGVLDLVQQAPQVGDTAGTEL